MVNWHFGLSQPTTGNNDFYAVAFHELAHVLGFGTADSFRNKVSGAFFTGAKAREAHGANVPMEVLSLPCSRWPSLEIVVST